MPVGAYAGANVSNGNGVTTLFPYNFKILDQTHIEVKVGGVLKVLGADYTVTGVGLSNGGNVVFGVAPANGAVVQRARKVPYTRSQDYQNNGDFQENTVDSDFDLLEMQVQQVEADATRAFKAPLSVTADQALSDAAWAARAGTILGFDALGNFTTYPSGTIATSVNVGHSPAGAGSIAETVAAALNRIVHTSEYASVPAFNAARDALTDTLGVPGLSIKTGSGIALAQSAETIGVKVLETAAFTAGVAPFQVHFNSFLNPGGVGTYNQAVHWGFNVNRHSAIAGAIAGQASLIWGMERNYYDFGGDNNYGVESYLEYFSPDGVSVQFRRPFYVRMLSYNNAQDNATVKIEVGADGLGQFVVKTDSAHTLLQVVPSSAAAQVNYLKITGGAAGVGPQLGALGEANAPLLLSSSGAGRVDIETGFFSRIGFRVVDIAASVNFLQSQPAATGLGPTLSAQGGDANVQLNLTSSGTGSVVMQTGGRTVLTLSNTALSVNSVSMTAGAAGVAAQIWATGEANAGLLLSSSGTGRIDLMTGVFGRVGFRVADTANAVDFLQVAGGATGAPGVVTLSAQGTDADVDIAITPKGAGLLKFGANTAKAAEAFASYITIKDSGGTSRKVMVCA